MTEDLLSAAVERQAIQDLVQDTAARLDQEDLDGWLALFDAELDYRMSAYSTELQREMTWWRSDRPALEKLLAEVPQHVRDPARRLHVVAPPRVALDGGRARASSTFVVLRICPDGETRLYAAGRYEDELVRRAEGWRYASRHVRMETRLLEVFTHLPL
jgi:3-phenylpropionate/cinnamic acid dioxygenase small subunit